MSDTQNRSAIHDQERDNERRHAADRIKFWQDVIRTWPTKCEPASLWGVSSIAQAEARIALWTAKLMEL
jgi:hypothetical protein